MKIKRFFIFLIFIFACIFFIAVVSCDDDDDSSGSSNSGGDPSSEDVWTDQVSGLMWEVNVSIPINSNWNHSKIHCEELTLAGYDDWYMPSIDELRSLILGCHKTEPVQFGGTCGVTNYCLTLDCLDYDQCSGCGNSTYGHYCPPGVSGTNSSFWSASTVEDLSDSAWVVGFEFADIGDSIKNSTDSWVRCVR